MQTVLITGANGFVGSYLSRLLLDDYKIVATGKGACRLDISHKNFHYESLDITAETEVSAVLSAFRPEVIVHAGALSKPDECELNKEQAFLTNVTSTGHLLNEAARLQSFFLFLSTDFIFSGQEGMYSEEDLAAPVNYYGQTKLEAEELVKQYPFAWSIVRTVLVYGHPQCGRQNILTMVANNLKAGQSMKIFHDQVRTPTFVEDLTQGIKTIIEKRAGGIFHLSGEDVRTPWEMAVEVADYLGFDNRLIEKVTEQSFSQPARRPPKTGFNLSKAKELLGYCTTPFAEGLRRTFLKA
jgi:dTDP-4-dehydrorhamnose reductase